LIQAPDFHNDLLKGILGIGDLLKGKLVIGDRNSTLYDHLRPTAIVRNGTLCDSLMFTAIQERISRRLAPVTETSSLIEFLEFYEKLLREMLAIEDSKFTIGDNLFSSAIIASINRHLGPLPNDNLVKTVMSF
ncbi:hypothetical protein Q9L58_010348, partial [Maublancomyces gigas]